MNEAGYRKVVKYGKIYYMRKETVPFKKDPDVSLLFIGFTVGVLIVAAIIGILVMLLGNS
jgi:hypothetical protein